MKTSTIMFSLAVLLVTARAADVVEAAVDCPVLGATGVGLDWDYNRYGEKGPADWAGQFEDCGGSKQSPIDFPLDVRYAPKTMGPKPQLKTITVSAVATNNNFALSCPVAGTCGHTIMGGVNYSVANAHFHAPSEHTLGGKQYPLELHIVHADPTATDFLVLAVMFDHVDPASYASQVHEAGGRLFGSNALLKATLPFVSGLAAPAEFKVPLAGVVEAEGGFCAYRGSLTTPPCSEAVTFYMSMNVQTVTDEQVFEYARAAGAGLHGNNRPLQSINGRDVTCYIK